MAILLSAQELAHTFGARPLFEGVSFTLSDGDRVGLIGPNGAGKSTLLRLLAGTLSPDRGQIARRGGLRVGVLPQIPSFAAGTTVRQAVCEGLSVSDDEGRVEEVLAKMDLGGGAVTPDDATDRLSGGWRKRVALARALV
ncbi:MAG TPA: ATP-binding cassette domain-containing protein, partial [Polyangia bacterium]|nr:ATP-binding cassette domain-containing protein [Polyangia bacterium]